MKCKKKESNKYKKDGKVERMKGINIKKMKNVERKKGIYIKKKEM